MGLRGGPDGSGVRVGGCGRVGGQANSADLPRGSAVRIYYGDLQWGFAQCGSAMGICYIGICCLGRSAMRIYHGDLLWGSAAWGALL